MAQPRVVLDTLHRRLREFAKKDDVSINQLITTAVEEKMAALSTLEYLEARAKRGSRKTFEAVLSRVPDVEPDRRDRPRATTQQQVPGEDAPVSAAPRRRTR